MQYLMAVDAGTGSVRAVIFNTRGEQVSIAQREWFHEEDPLYPGSMDFNVIENWRLIKDCIRESIAQAGIKAQDILALSCTSMREGLVLYDEQGHELFACANVDARADREVSELHDLRVGLERDIYHMSGQVFALGALPRLLWFKNNKPAQYEKVRVITMLNDWIAYKLTGVLGVDPSNGCTTGIFDYKSRAWDPAIAGMCGLKTNIFPTVYEAGQRIEKVSKEAAGETGLADTTQVIAGGGDAQIGSVGIGTVKNKDCCIFGGSFWQTEVNTSEPITDKECRIRLNAHAIPGLWQYEAIAFNPGLAMRWFRDAFCQAEKLVEEKTGVSVYTQMDKEAVKVPVGSFNVYPIFSDVMNFINWKHAAPSFVNMSLDADRCNKYTLYRSLMENAALLAFGNLRAIEKFSGIKVTSVVFAGGAAKSAIWSGILADVLGIPIKTPVIKEAASLGAAMCAGVGAGVFNDFTEAADVCVKFAEDYEPNIQNHTLYGEIYETWQKIYTKQLQLADAGLTNHMWKAPGL